LNNPSKGRSTCASACALNLEAQPEQFDNVVSRIFFSEGVSLLFVFIVQKRREAQSELDHASRNTLFELRITIMDSCL
jgi:hypothetical protein